MQPRSSGAPVRSQLHALTGLRFVAALQVLVFHCVPWTSWSIASFQNIAGSGYVAVSLFFVLSGFILTYAHGAPGARALELNHFYLSRFARLYPVYAFALALVAPFYFVHTIRIRGVIWLAEQVPPVALLLQAWLPSAALEWNPPAWSLSAEAFFYVLFPLVAARLMAARRGTAVAVGVASYAACLLVPLAYLRFRPDGPIALNHESTAFWLSVLRYNPAVRFPEFVIGIVFARFYLDRRLRADHWGAPAAVGSVVLAAVILTILAHSEELPYPVLHNGLLAPLFALLIVTLAFGRGPVAAVLSTRPMVALGDASYSLYLLHIPLAIYWSKLMLHIPERIRSSAATNGAFLVLVVAASLLCHRFVELPLRDRVLQRWPVGRRPSKMAS